MPDGSTNVALCSFVRVCTCIHTHSVFHTTQAQHYVQLGKLPGTDWRVTPFTHVSTLCTATPLVKESPHHAYQHRDAFSAHLRPACKFAMLFSSAHLMKQRVKTPAVSTEQMWCNCLPCTIKPLHTMKSRGKHLSMGLSVLIEKHMLCKNKLKNKKFCSHSHLPPRIQCWALANCRLLSKE